MVLNKRLLILSMCLLLLVVLLPSQISAGATTLNSEDFCTKIFPGCIQHEPVIRYECRNNDTWRITITKYTCPDGYTYTNTFEEPYLYGQCPYGGPES